MNRDSRFSYLAQEQPTPSSSSSSSSSSRVMNSRPPDSSVTQIVTDFHGVIFIVWRRSVISNIKENIDQRESNLKQLLNFIVYLLNSLNLLKYASNNVNFCLKNGLIDVEQFISDFQVNSFLQSEELPNFIRVY